jgi:NADP-dependent 3-hydroxy acid dehydrogenase YdfG
MSRAQYQGEIVWIIGASSGIGAALARELAAQGATLALSARRTEALTSLAHTLGGTHNIFALDVADAAAVTRTANAIRDAFGRIDRVIFMAAAYTPMKLLALDMAATKQMIEVNLLGAFHVVEAVLPVLTQQGRGQLALCGSVAGYTGLPGGQPYSATKAGIINLAESLRAELPRSIDVKLISPGFVKSELTDKNEFNMPMIITAERAAGFIADGLRRNGFEIHFPRRFTLWLKLLRALPYGLSLRITRNFNA